MRVNCLAPHTILTEQIQVRAPEEWRQRMAAAVPTVTLAAVPARRRLIL